MARAGPRKVRAYSREFNARQLLRRGVTRLLEKPAFTRYC